MTRLGLAPLSYGGRHRCQAVTGKGHRCRVRAKWRLIDTSQELELCGTHTEVERRRRRAVEPDEVPDTCRFCGSDELWANYFNRRGEGTDGSRRSDRWRVLCETCGTFQDEKGHRP